VSTPLEISVASELISTMSTDVPRYNSPLFKRTNYLQQLQKIVGIDELEPVMFENEDDITNIDPFSNVTFSKPASKFKLL
jgi:hypothetical protein